MNLTLSSVEKLSQRLSLNQKGRRTAAEIDHARIDIARMFASFGVQWEKRRNSHTKRPKHYESMSTNPDKLELPPFPSMDWDDCDWWVGDVTLEFGQGVELNVTPYDPDENRLPSNAQSDAMDYQLQNGQHVIQIVLDSLMSYYQQMRPKYLDFLGNDAARLMPELHSPERLKNLIDLRQVHVHPWEKSGMAYIGLQFGCTWDVEHGLGVLMHKDRVVEIGGADVSFASAPDEADNL